MPNIYYNKLGPERINWTDLTLLNSWITDGPTPFSAGFLAINLVVLRSRITAGTGIVATLPPNYRPANIKHVATVAHNNILTLAQAIFIKIAVNGDITIQGNDPVVYPKVLMDVVFAK